MSTLESKVAELKSITGCLGGFVSRDGVSVASSLPPVYDRARLDRIAANVRKVAALADKSGFAGADVVLRYSKANLDAMPLGDGAFLTLACEPSASIATIEALAGVAADDLREALAARASPPERAASPVSSAPPPPAVDPAARLDDLRATALALYGAPLGTVKALFIAEVGPIGELIFRSALDHWVDAGPIDWHRAAELRDVLAAEIDDARSRARFDAHAVWTRTSR